ncbi:MULTISPECIES: VOC family protein [Amycolatopsis]|uniref:VOC family protein n=1 Tax=Amycolatopsis albidoflavus TaxID=102226 RepID=A0ABW5I5K9_9PSEU
MADNDKAGFRGIGPYLYYENAAAALEWLAEVFGFAEVARYADESGVVREAEMRAGDAQISLHGADPGYWAAQGVPGPVGHMCIVYVDNVDAQWERIRAAGVDGVAPEDKPYGARIAMVTDPGGHQWTFWQHLSDDVELDEGWSEIKAEPPGL